MKSYIYCVLLCSILVLIYKEQNKLKNYKETLSEIRDELILFYIKCYNNNIKSKINKTKKFYFSKKIT